DASLDANQVHQGAAKEAGARQRDVAVDMGGDVPLASGPVTAVLVTPTSFTWLYTLVQEINGGREAQAALPGQVLGRLFELLGVGQRLLNLLVLVALGLAAITVLASLYGAIVERRRDLAVLRALGAGRRMVLGVALLESTLVVVCGLALGTLLGHGTSLAIA